MVLMNEKTVFGSIGDTERAKGKDLSGRLDEAKEICAILLRNNQNHPKALHMSGIIAYQEGETARAIKMLSDAVEAAPDRAEIFCDLGTIYFRCRELEKAISCYQTAVSLSPEVANTHYVLGNIYKTLGKLDRAALCYKRTIQLNPTCCEAYINLGLVFKNACRANDAISCFQKAAEIDSKSFEATNNLGVVLQEQGKIYKALYFFEKAFKMETKSYSVCMNLANTYKELGITNKALKFYKHAKELEPESPDAYVGMGIIYQDLDNYEEAIENYHKTLKINPDYGLALCNLVNLLMLTCSWNDLEILNAKVDRYTKKMLSDGMKPDEMPFLNLSRHADPRLNQAVAEAWSNQVSLRVGEVRLKSTYKFEKINKKRINIAYLSNNIKNHPTAYLIHAIFQHHDRNKFRIFCYSYGENDKSAYRNRIRRDCDKFVDLNKYEYEEAASRINEDNIDILIDLVGYMKGNRMEIAACRPAPIQVRWLGMAGTTGAAFFDYIITDRIVTPEEQALFYNEKFVYMPHCYQVNSNVFSSCTPKSKSDWGLPEDKFIFCSFNTGYKIERTIFKCWMKILKRVENSVLWLMVECKWAEENLKKVAELEGINPERLVFARRVSRKFHFERLKCADLVLDTKIVNGAATTSDALWTGVPVVTLIGNHFASRMGASILSAIGISDLITRDVSEYEELAVSLGQERQELETIRQKLKDNIKCSPLFDTKGFVKNLERALEMMWNIYLNNENPQELYVS